MNSFLQRVSPTVPADMLQHIGRSADEVKQILQISDFQMSAEQSLQRRLAHRNETNLYKRRCDATGREIVAAYHQNVSFPVYANDFWWGDSWQAQDYGRNFDFRRPFFEQFYELLQEVPRMAMKQEQMENSIYNNCVSHLKNCYLLFSADYNRDCAYSCWLEHCNDCYDNYLLTDSELCYETVFCRNLYDCAFAYLSENCKNSRFLFDCRSCNDCFMCIGLERKQYCILNQQYSKEDYFKELSKYNLGSQSELQTLKKRFFDAVAKVPKKVWKFGRMVNSTGSLMTDVENCQNCDIIWKGKDCKEVLGYQIKDAWRCDHASGELGYENSECFPMPFKSAFNLGCYGGSDIYYSDTCMNNCQNLFGCVGMKKAKYCILNKQYSPEEYFSLMVRIVMHMRETGEWGQFLPEQYSIFGYNETQAFDKFPLSREEALERGFKWFEESVDSSSTNLNFAQFVDDIVNADADVCKSIYQCSVSGEAFKVIPQEFAFLKRMGLALPMKSSTVRMRERREIVDRFALK